MQSKPKMLKLKQINSVPENKNDAITRLRTYLEVELHKSKRDIQNNLYMVNKIIREHHIFKPDYELLNRVVKDLQDKKRAPDTIRLYIWAFKYWARSLKYDLKIEKMPTATIKEPDALSVIEMRSLIGACDNFRDRALVSIYAFCGVRPGELVNFELCDYVKDKHTLLVRDHVGHRIKTKYERDVIIPPEAIRYFNEWLDNRPDVECKKIFLNIWLQPFTVNGINQLVKRKKKLAGIERRVYSYMLRKSCATYLVNDKKMSVKLAAKQLGNSPNVLLKHYVRADTKAIKDFFDNNAMY